MIDAATSEIAANSQTLALVILAYVAGAMTPLYYAQERMRGFGRAMMARIPYQPPPGEDEQQAMEDATDE